MSGLNRAGWALVVALVWFAAPGCVGPEVRATDEAPSDPDVALAPGLALLTPYSDRGEMLRGLRWLDNFALSQPQSAAGHQARYWLLRARLDWLTRAYLEPEQSVRAAELQALMEHVGVAHGGSLTNAELFAVIEVLEGHARGLERISGYEDVGGGALALLEVFRNLDLSPGYFEAIARLRAAMPDVGMPAPKSAAIFAPNALLIASTDLLAQLPALSQLTPERQPHLLAKVMAYSCPRGLVAFASASLEEREEVLREMCGWPCPELGEQPSPDRQAVIATCGHAVFSGASLFSVGNEAMVRMLADLSLMGRQQRLLVVDRAAAEARFPVLADRWAPFDELLGQLDALPFVLDLPEYHGEVRLGATDVTLPRVRYTRPPEVAAVSLELGSSGHVQLSHQPVARVTHKTVSFDAGHSPGAPSLQLTAWGRSGWDAERARLDELVGATLRESAAVFGFDADAIGPANVIPRVVAGVDAPTKSLLAVGDALAHRGHPRVDLAVADTALKRSGLVRLWLRRDRPPRAPWVRVERDMLVLGVPKKGGGWSQVRLQVKDSALPLTALYLKLMPLAAASSGERLPTLGVEVAPDVPLQHVTKVLDVVRYWWLVSDDASGEALLNASPQAMNRIPKVLVERLVWVLPQ